MAWRLDKGRHFDASELGEAGGRNVCDIGCGDGDNLRRLKSAGFRVVGVEPDDKARSFASGVATVFDGTAEQLPNDITSQSFSVILLSHVLEHCIDPIIAIKNIKSILEPDGQIVIEVPNNAARGFDTFKEYWPWSDIPRHISFFSEASLRKLLDICGLQVNSVRYVGFTRQFMPEWIRMQSEIWDAVGKGKRPGFSAAAWKLLARTAVAAPDMKYDTVRVQAQVRTS